MIFGNQFEPKQKFMNEVDDRQNEDIFERVIRAGRRTYFFDVRETKAGDYYVTITESKKLPTKMALFITENTKFTCIKKISTTFKMR